MSRYTKLRYQFEDLAMTDPQQRAVKKFRVFLTFPVTTCVLVIPSEVTAPLSFSITYIRDINE